MVPGAQPAAARWVESRESKWRMWRSGKAWRRRARSIMPGLRARDDAPVANRRAGCQPNAARFSHDRTPAKIVGQKSTRETTRKQGFPSSGWSARRCLPKLRDKKRVALAWQAVRDPEGTRVYRRLEFLHFQPASAP